MSNATDALADYVFKADPYSVASALVTRSQLRALAREAYELGAADLAAAQAVIEQAPHADTFCTAGEPYGQSECVCWKSQLSSSALAAHDAEVFDQGWDACRYGMVDPQAARVVPYQNPYRAQALRDGQETT